jgi:putative protein-disulfide isomerase
MPIDGDIWLEDPLNSSYPPSIAFKAAYLQGPKKAIHFLRELREMVFLKKINIAKWSNMAIAAKKAGLNVVRLETDFNGCAGDLFRGDLQLAQQLGVRGFPTLFFVDDQGNQERVYGTKPYTDYEAALIRQLPQAAKMDIDGRWQNLFSEYNTLTMREFSGLSDSTRQQGEQVLKELAKAGHIHELVTKNGSLWILQ